MRFFAESRDSEYYARKVKDTGGVYLVPAFTGLGAPHWDMYARGCIVGMTRGTRREHIIRAALESITYQSLELVEAMEKDSGIPLAALNVDGGASQNGFLMQFQSDILNKPVCRPQVGETTALGAAYLAGLATGIWKNAEEIKKLRSCDASFMPQMDSEKRALLLKGWRKAVGRSLDWEEPASSHQV
jgi:glycerol kinase